MDERGIFNDRTNVEIACEDLMGNKKKKRIRSQRQKKQSHNSSSPHSSKSTSSQRELSQQEQQTTQISETPAQPTAPQVESLDPQEGFSEIQQGEGTSRWVTQRPLSALLTLRFGFFTLFAYDVWTIGLSHAPRYGVTDFNVTHLAWLDRLAPSPSISLIGALYLATGGLALCAAVGLVGRLGIALCALLYGASYFWSQADSYQHHYLLFLCLTLFIGAPWRSSEAKGGLSLRALMWQLALIYGWTALAKVDDAWLSGETLKRTISSPEVRGYIEDGFTTLNQRLSLGLKSSDVYWVGAWSVMLGELFAAIAFLAPPLRPIAFFIVPWFHIGVEWIGFDIELFSYYMILLNLTLLSPAWMWRPLERLIGVKANQKSQASGLAEGAAPKYLRQAHLVIALVGATLVGVIISKTQLEGSYYGAWLAAITVFSSIFFAGLYSMRGSHLNITQRFSPLPASLSWWSGQSLRLFLVGAGLWIGTQHVTSSSFRFDYYRMWGGDLKRRGELDRAYEVYQIANQAQTPDAPARFVQAGEVALKLNRFEEGVTALSEGCRRRLIALEEAALIWTELYEQSKLNPTKVSPQEKAQVEAKFRRAGRSALKAQQTLYQAYQRQRDPRAREQRYMLEEVRHLILQTEQITRD